MRLVFDLESDGPAPRNVKNVWCVAAACLDSNREWLFPPDKLPAAIDLLNEATQLIGHNIISYDLPVIRRVFQAAPKGTLVDTLIISRLLNPDRTGVYRPDGSYIAKPHSLEAWGTRLGRYKPDHTDWTQFSDAMMHRCMEDVRINKLLYWRLYDDTKA